MSFSQLQNQLLQTYSGENLNRLSVKIIDYQKNKQTHCLLKIGKLVNEFFPLDLNNNSKLFAKLIMLYHPDKQVEYNKGISECNNEEALNKFAHIIPMLKLVEHLDDILITYRNPKSRV